MSNYVKTTNFLRKDSLPDTDNDKIIRGSEFDIEFNNLVIAVASKANIVSPAFTGVPTAPTASAGTSTTQIATTAFVAQNAILTGMIVMWSGSVATIPLGYVLCDGDNSTPDLTDKFIMGAGSTYNPEDTGGSADATLPSHNHSFSDTTSSAGSHTHFVVSSSTSSNPSFNSNSAMTWASAGGLGNSDYRGGSSSGTANRGKSNSAPDHSHSVSGNTSTSGASATNANLPPYFALAFIMKT